MIMMLWISNLALQAHEWEGLRLGMYLVGMLIFWGLYFFEIKMHISKKRNLQA